MIILCLFNILSLDIEFTKLPQIVYNMMRDANSFFGLLKCILVPMDLRKNSAVLKFKLAKQLEFAHAVRHAFFFEIELVGRYVF